MWKRRRTDELESVNILELKPCRLADWISSGEKIVLIRPKPKGGGLRTQIDKMLYLMSARRIRLDDLGSFSWLCLDGKLTVGEVANQLREKFGDAAEPAEERLGHLVRVLRREGLVGFRDWDDDAILKKTGEELSE